MFPTSIASKLKNIFFISSLGLLMQLFHVRVEITVVIICHFLLFDYKNICGYVQIPPFVPETFKILGWCPAGSVLRHGEKVPL